MYQNTESISEKESTMTDEYETDRRTGGAGASRQPLSDDDYRRGMDNLLAMAGK